MLRIRIYNEIKEMIKIKRKLCLPLILSALMMFGPVSPVTRVQAKSMKISASRVTLYKGKSKKLTVNTKKKIRWSSTNKKVATVSKKGKVTAKKKGTATIKAKVGKKTFKCKVTVKNPSISKSKLSIPVGTTYQFKARGLSNVKWSSSDTNKASISSSGLMTTYATGKVTIKAKAGKKTYKCKVTVNNKGVTGTASVGTVALMSAYDVNVSHLKSASYASASEGVAVTTKGGMIKPVSAGTADITITGMLNNNAYSNTIHLTVTGGDVQTGIDLSSHNGNVNFSTLKSNNISFAILRAGAGNIADTKFVSNVTNAKAAGMKVGVYWYLRSNDSKTLMTTQEAHDQALALVNILKNNNITLDMPIYLDLESPTLYNAASTVTYTETLVTAFRDVLIVYGYDDVGIYSNANYFRSYLNSTFFTYFSHLWLARYAYAGRQPSITLAGTTLTPEIWQSNQTYNVSGTNGSVDLNYYY